jgi:nucleotide-binding universal stress UspA family protein
MNILVCSDGTLEAQNAVRYIGQLLAARGTGGVRLTLLGVAEEEKDVAPLGQALERERQTLLDLCGQRAEVLTRAGDPTREILARSLIGDYDLVVIGARRKGGSGLYWRSARVYEIIKSVQAPVLIVVGRRESVKRALVCTGGRRYINQAIKLTARLLAPAGVNVTLLHVTAEAPAVYTGFRGMESNPARLLEDDSDLARNLRAECETFVAVGMPAEVRLRGGIVLNEIADEFRTGNYDLVVTGSTLARGSLRQYILGDLTREIVNRAGCPVLIVRSGSQGGKRPIFLRRSGWREMWKKVWGGGA